MPSWLPTVIFVPLVGFGLYRRYKRSFGKQPYTPKRMIARMVLLAVVLTVFVASAPQELAQYGLAGVGALLGIALGVVALRTTRFDLDGEEKSYTPNGWIGLVVTALFIGR